MRKIILFLALAFLLVSIVQAAEATYPIAELGNCASEDECAVFCDEVANMETCLNYAEKTGMMTSDEIAEARKFLPYLIAGETPGKCKSESECGAYCDKEENLEECINFALKIGEIGEEEAEMIKKTGGKGPGGCKGKEECDKFCEDEANFAACVDFAVEHGMMDASEAEMAKKTGGKGPGGCKGKEECDSYCTDESHFSECVDFAVEHGMMDAKDAEIAKKTGGKGPGGCKGEEECNEFCNNQDNMETCTNFAIEYELGSPEEIEKMKKNLEWMRSSEGQCYSQCIKNAGLSFNDCGENGGPAGCQECGDECFPHNSGNCLTEERWEQLNQDCQAKGSGYHLEEVRGDDGQGGECVIDETCVYSEGQEWESQEEKDRKLAEMEVQWEKERAEYEAQNGPGTQGTESYTGGCTEPGPEGQCGSGDSGGSESGSEGTTPGDETGGTPGGTTSGEGGVGSGGSYESGDSGSSGGGDAGGSSGGDSGSSGGSSSGDSGGGSSGGDSGGSSGGDVGVTGGVIMHAHASLNIKDFFKRFL